MHQKELLGTKLVLLLVIKNSLFQLLLTCVSNSICYVLELLRK